MMEMAALMTAFTTLFVVIDAPGLTPLYIALTRGMSETERRAIGRRACLTAGVLMLLFLFIGEAVLGFAGISMSAFRIAGGVLLFLTALDMLFDRRQARRENNAAESSADPGHDPSVFPLAIPLIVGPGVIATIILLAGEAHGPADYGVIAGLLAVNLLIVYLFFLASPIIERVLGRVGINVVTRILGMFLAALAVQFIIDGLRSSGFAA